MRLQCPTCFEGMVGSEPLESLPCGHTFHKHCILQWFESKKNCPQCRKPANEGNIRRIYLTVEEEDTQKNPEDLRLKLENLQVQERMTKMELANLRSLHEKTIENNVKLKDALKKTEKKANDSGHEIYDLKFTIKQLTSERNQFQQFKVDAERYKTELDQMTLLRDVINKSTAEVNLMLHERGCFDRESRDLSTLVVQLKDKLVDKKQEKAQCERKLKDMSIKFEEERRKLKNLSIEIAELKSSKENMSTDLKLALERVSSQSDEIEHLQAQLAKNNNHLSDMSWSDKDEQEMENVSLSSMESPLVASKPISILIREKKKPSITADDLECRSKMRPNLMEVGRLKRIEGKGYNGLGGHSKPDVFPQPTKNRIKKPTKKTSLLLNREKQSKTIDKFFGNFDSP